MTENGTITKDTDEFGKSWLHRLPSETECIVIPEPGACMPLHPDEDPCFKILDEERFGGVSYYTNLVIIKLLCWALPITLSILKLNDVLEAGSGSAIRCKMGKGSS
jgi:hypothetical protein